MDQEHTAPGVGTARSLNLLSATLAPWEFIAGIHRRYSGGTQMQDLVRELRALPAGWTIARARPDSFLAAYAALHAIGRASLAQVEGHRCWIDAGWYCARCSRIILVGLLGDALLFWISDPDDRQARVRLANACALEAAIAAEGREGTQDGPGATETTQLVWGSLGGVFMRPGPS